MRNLFQPKNIKLLDLKKTPSFLKLREWRERGHYQQVQILCPPRVGSTSLYCALAESPQVSGAIFEPVNPIQKKFPSLEAHLEYSAGQMLQLALRLGMEEKPVTLVTKEITTHLPAPIFQHWQELIDHFIFLVEDPHKQIESFLSALANGRTFGKKGADGLPLLTENGDIALHPKSEEQALWPKVAEMLQKKAFKQIGWEAAWQTLELASQHCQKHSGKKLVTLEASALKLNPELMLGKLCEKLAPSLTFSSNMAGPWTRANGKNFFHPNAPSYERIWVGPVVRAQRFAPPAVKTVSTRRFPDSIARYILEIGLPTYIKFLSHTSTVLPTSAEMRSLLGLTVGTSPAVVSLSSNSFFMTRSLPLASQACPIMAVSILERLRQEDPSLERLSAYIQSQHPGLAETFQIMTAPKSESGALLGRRTGAGA